MSRLFRACNPTYAPLGDRAVAAQKRCYFMLAGSLAALLVISLLIVAIARPVASPVEIMIDSTNTTLMTSVTSTPTETSTSAPIATATTATTSTTNAPTPTPASRPPTQSDLAEREPTALVFMLSDGMGPASLTLARVCGNRTNLALDAALVGTVRTYSTSSLVTDSAAGATAYACGRKSFNGAIAVDDNDRAIGSILAAAQRQGMPVGLVATSRITHATPAAFSAHSLHRDYEEYIAAQQAIAGIDVLFGGGRDMFEARNDSRHLLAEMAAAGYALLGNASDVRELEARLARDAAAAVAMAPVIGLFAADHMNYEIDRDNDLEPSLSEMARLALRILHAKAQARGTGYFLMVEGSRIDMAAHDNDAAAQWHETLAYDDAFRVVSEFATQAGVPHARVVATSDHETGGLSLGRRPDSFFEYPTYEWLPEPLRRPRQSSFAISARMLNASTLAEQAALARAYVGDDVADDELAKYADLVRRNESKVLQYELGNDLARRAVIGWSTIGHSGTDVNLYTVNDAPLPDTALAQAPLPQLATRGSRLLGNVENSDVGVYMQAALGLVDTVAMETSRLATLDVSEMGAYSRMDGYMVRKRDAHHFGHHI